MGGVLCHNLILWVLVFFKDLVLYLVVIPENAILGVVGVKNHEECILVDVDLQIVNSFEHFCQQRGALHLTEKLS